MDIKIFAAGFTEKEFNDFCQKNIVYKYHFNPDGSAFVMWKAANRLGNLPIELIDMLDRLVKQAETERNGALLDIQNITLELADLRTEQAKFGPNEKEWKAIDSRVASLEVRVKMAQETIVERNRQIDTFKTKGQDILNEQA